MSTTETLTYYTVYGYDSSFGSDTTDVFKARDDEHAEEQAVARYGARSYEITYIVSEED